jgi:hypothetical protein
VRKLNVVLLIVFFAGGLVDWALGQTKDFQIEPSGVQLNLSPGHSSTTAFLIKTGSIGVLHERLLVNIVDWEFNKTGFVFYKEPGTSKRSASSWISIQPISVPIGPESSKVVRIIVSVPRDAVPGIYTSAVLVTETVPELPEKAEAAEASAKADCAFTILITVKP